MDKKIKDMSYDKLVNFVNHNELTPSQISEVKDRLGGILWDIGVLWDKATNVDPKPFVGTYGGTGNHKSMTYKLRKVAGYSYP